MILNGVYTSVWADEGECEMKMHKIYGVDKNICTAEKMLLKCGTGGMKMKKYELTNEYITYLGRKLYRIKALKNFGNVKIDELGGYIEKEDNLSQDGNAWVYGEGGMKMKKYELTNEYITYLGRKLYRIKALKNFGNVKIDELGGYIEKEDNLSQDGNAWVYGDAIVFGDAIVAGNARVFGDTMVFGNAIVFGNNYSCSNKE